MGILGIVYGMILMGFIDSEWHQDYIYHGYSTY